MLIMTDVLVIGAGVSGLTTGICLAEAGLAVTIRAERPPEHTTSLAAGALWGPVMAGPPDRVMAWARSTRDVLIKLAERPDSGVRLASGKELTRAETELPYWAGLVPDLRYCTRDEVPPGFVSGWHYTAPLATMPVYLDYLSRRFQAAGGRIETGRVESLDGVTVNCAGAGARYLVPDPAVEPVRGQVVIAENPGITEFLISRDETPPHTVYLFPHGDTILIGGTVQAGDWDLTVQPLIAERIMANASAIEPALRGVRILDHRVGLRPRRPSVRLEFDGSVWHNYGHGGAGISLSWGCAQEVAAGVLG
jgi:D-amino-acid oxidase